jgi:hypothetical protein
LGGIDRIEFGRRMQQYRQALKILLDLHEEWLRSTGFEDLQREHAAAYEQVDHAYKALLARIKKRQDIPAIARYFATQTVESGEFWRSEPILKAIANAL